MMRWDGSTWTQVTSPDKGNLVDILNGVAPRPFWSTHARLESQYATRA